ncbi:hypothetical protein [Methanobrevibacter sp. DSM 116169]|uniref:hypothetical protein n=1 Tax=Methanobrevibacter sp. DSM 116169 TaxID=3242727 RepID=UPI0038FCF3BE
MNRLIIIYNNSKKFLVYDNEDYSKFPHPNEYDLKGYESLTCVEEILRYVSNYHHVFLSIANDIYRDINDAVVLKLDIDTQHLRNNIMLLAGNIKNNITFNVKVGLRDDRTFEEKIASGCDFPDEKRGTLLHSLVLSDIKVGKKEVENYNFEDKFNELKSSKK